MKPVALLLSMIVLLLNNLPCCFQQEVPVRSYTEQGAAQKGGCDDMGNDACKGCSPFYVCGSCAGFVHNDLSGFTFILPLRSSSYNGIYIPLELKQVASLIWQPPKIG